MTQWTYGTPAAYRCDPYTEVEVYNPKSRWGWKFPIVSFDKQGVMHTHELSGQWSRVGQNSLDLVPLREKPRECWVLWFGDTPGSTYLDEDEARASAAQYDTAKVVFMAGPSE